MPKSNETILNNNAKKLMVEWDGEKFKKDFPMFYKVVLISMNEARLDELKTHNEAVNPKEKGC